MNRSQALARIGGLQQEAEVLQRKFEKRLQVILKELEEIAKQRSENSREGHTSFTAVFVDGRGPPRPSICVWLKSNG